MIDFIVIVPFLGLLFERRKARSDICELDGFGGLSDYAFGRPYTDGCRRSWINHRLQQGGGCGRSALLETSDSLPERGPASLPVGALKLGELQPAKEGSSPNSAARAASSTLPG